MDRDQLVADNLDLPHKILNLYYPNHRHREDLLSEGFLALVRCSRRYDPDRGCQFRSYAAHRIRGTMRDWVRLPYRKGGTEIPCEFSTGDLIPAAPTGSLIELLEIIHSLRDASVLLRYAEGKHGTEIAREDGCSEVRVSQRLKRGRAQLLKELLI